MAMFNRIDHDPKNLNEGSTFQIMDATGRVVELTKKEAEELTNWLTSFLHPEWLERGKDQESS